MIGGPLRLVARLVVTQFAPFVERNGGLLIFSSHHAPLWKTGRHVVIIYDLISLRHPDQARLQNVFFRLFLPRVLKSATRIVTISGTVRDELKDTFGFLADRKIDVIPAYSKALEAPVEPSAHRSSRLRHVLVVGARYPHKNLALVLDAMALMAEQGHGERLVVAGIRRELWSDRDSWRRMEEEGLLETIEFPLDLELRQLYERAHCLVYPSFDEGQGLPPLEVLRHGRPVVCSDIPVLRETCGRASFFVDPRDPAALASLLNQVCRGECEAEIDEMRQAASEILDRFSGPEIMKRWTALLASLS
jgi:glycosyltransferase involved in cell wall biosynthesis